MKIKVNSSLIIYIYILYILFISVVKCDIFYYKNLGFEDRTPVTKESSHFKYPDYTNVNTCSYTFYYYTICTQGSSIPLLELSGASITVALQNSTSAIYRVYYSMDISTGSFNLTLNFTFSGCGVAELVETSVDIGCYEYQLDTLTFSSGEITYSGLYGWDTSLLKIGGLKYPIQSIAFLNIDMYVEIAENTFLIMFSNCNYRNDYSTNDIITNSCNYTISFNDSQKVIFVSPGYINSKLNNISEIKTYPDYSQTDTYNQISYYYYSAITFKLKSDVYYPFKVLAYKSVTYRSGRYYPMYGDSDGITYLYNLEKTSPSGIDSVLYYQNGSKAIQATTFTFKQIDAIRVTNNFLYSTFQEKENLFIFTPSLTTSSYEYVPVYYSHNSFAIKGVPFNYPFGFKSGLLTDLQYEASFYCSNIYKSVIFGQIMPVNTYTIDRTGIVDITPPTVTYFEIIDLGYSYSKLTVVASDPSGIGSIRFAEEGASGYNAETVLKSGSLTDGIFEIVYSQYDIAMGLDTVYVVDIYGNSAMITKDSFYSVGAFSYQPPYSESVPNLINLISSVSFDKYEMDVSDSSNTDLYNTMYITLTEPIGYSIYLFVFDGRKGYENHDYTLGEKSSNQTLYTFRFSLKKNMLPGPLAIGVVAYSSYHFLTSDIIYSKAIQPLVIKSSTPDVSGPFVTNIVKLAGDSIVDLNTEPNQLVGWNITIEDKINGFSHGYIGVLGLVDGSIYNFTLVPNIIGEKSVTFTIILSNISCIAQTFQIVQVSLYDRCGYLSSYILNENVQNNVVYIFNPLLYYLGNQDALKLQVSCKPVSLDEDGPILLSITPNVSTIDVGSHNRSISFTLVVQDLESGINTGLSPTIYISSLFFNTVECKSTLSGCTADDIECTYKCDIELPFAFGFPNKLIYQVYGIWNKQGLFSGYSYSSILTLAQGFIETQFSKNIPIIQETSSVNNFGGELLILGRYLGDSESVIVSYSNGTNYIATPTCVDIYCFIQLLESDLSFSIQIELKDKTLSNIYKIKPLKVGNIQNISDSSSTEYTCPGQPVCGGSSNGYCTSKGCVCISPWYGIECKQKVIIVPQPSFNGTDPNITIIVPPTDNGNNNGNNQIEYTSLTSIVSIREIDINNEPIQTYPFSKWYNNQINSTYNEYYSNFTNINNSDQTTQVKVIVQWFNNQTNITFAGNQLTMNPSSIKYTIEVKDYPFKNKLNSLEIVMSALFQSTNSESCSSKEFGESNGYDNSDYLKLQVGDHSLYARFIKRGIIDNSRTVSVSNRLLDNSFTTINQASQIQSYIGINIQNFDNIAIIDPDFSVMLDFSKSTNSICKQSSKLTSTQIVGIVIGSVAFAAIIVISFVYYYIKKKRDLKAMSDLSNKLKNLS